MNVRPLEALKAETIRIADEVASTSFAASLTNASAGDYFIARSTLANNVRDGVVSELDLLSAATLMQTAIRAAEAAHVHAQRGRTAVRRDLATSLSLEKGPLSEKQIQKEMRGISDGWVDGIIARDKEEADKRLQEVSALAALHGAIQAQLGAQPGLTSAMEYLKDNAVRFGVIDAVNNAVSATKPVINAAKPIVDKGVAVAKPAIEAIERKLGTWFGSR